MTRTMIRCSLAAAMALASVLPARAQGSAPAVSFKPFVLVSGEQFAARRTFEAAFTSAFQPMWGGGLEVVFGGHLFVDVTASRFSKTGQRAFITSTSSYQLGIPLTVEVTPLEVSGGYRFAQVSPRVIPYVAVGYGSYAYTESSPPPYSDATENVDTRHGGFLLNGGAEIRLHRWVGVAVDAQYTHVTGILGQGGLSQAAGESDLGGTAVRARVLIGR